MRVAIISDIHGNSTALEAVLHDLEQQPPVDQIIIAGDLCLNGPRPKEVLEIVQSLRCPVLKGNVDDEVAKDPDGLKAKKRNVVAWTRDQIGQKGIDYLNALPHSYLVSNAEGTDLLVVHANPLNLEDAIFPTTPDSMLEHLTASLPPAIGAIAFGHYHVAYTRRWRQLLLIDVGSCGLPRDLDTRASYAIISWKDHMWQVEHRRVLYDIKAVVEQLQKSGIPHVEKRIKILTEASY